MMEASASEEAGVDKGLARGGIRLAVWLYQRTGGRIGGMVRGAPVLLLTTTGRKSGQLWTVPLVYRTDGDRLVVVASNGGAARHPAWWLNLRTHPHTTVQVGRERRAVSASEATGAERDRLWELMVDLHAGYADYQRKTRRRIPVVVLEPH
jgi:F420H(2)-dependent quinone reductase